MIDPSISAEQIIEKLYSELQDAQLIIGKQQMQLLRLQKTVGHLAAMLEAANEKNKVASEE